MTYVKNEGPLATQLLESEHVTSTRGDPQVSVAVNARRIDVAFKALRNFDPIFVLPFVELS